MHNILGIGKMKLITLNTFPKMHSSPMMFDVLDLTIPKN